MCKLHLVGDEVVTRKHEMPVLSIFFASSIPYKF